MESGEYFDGYISILLERIMKIYFKGIDQIMNNTPEITMRNKKNDIKKFLILQFEDCLKSIINSPNYKNWANIEKKIEGLWFLNKYFNTEYKTDLPLLTYSSALKYQDNPEEIDQVMKGWVEKQMTKHMNDRLKLEISLLDQKISNAKIELQKRVEKYNLKQFSFQSN